MLVQLRTRSNIVAMKRSDGRAPTDFPQLCASLVCGELEFRLSRLNTREEVDPSKVNRLGTDARTVSHFSNEN